MNQSRNPNLGALGEEDIRENSPNQIQRGRVWNDLREGLEREFRKIDRNNDNNVDLDELRSYLLGRLRETLGGFYDEAAKSAMLKYIDEMFTSIDGNENGLVSIDELVEYYAMSILDIRDDIEELQERI